MPFTPGLVGGHCIGVDPYYLTAAAERFGYHPEVILAGRRINDSMGSEIARKLVKLLAKQAKPVTSARVAILGLTFKENVPDLRNSKVPDIVAELQEFAIEPIVIDPLASPAEAWREYAIRLCSLEDCADLDAVVVAVPHASFRQLEPEWFVQRLNEQGVVVDIKSMFRGAQFPPNILYWSL